MNIIRKKCEICSINENKYKCPKCLILYCSLNCYKTHKDNCSSNNDNSNAQLPEARTDIKTEVSSVLDNTAAAVSASLSITDSIQTEIKSNQSEFADSSTDFVSSDKLQKLGQSNELKQVLSNVHLRELLVNLNNKGTQINQDMERLMQEPLFREFSDVCLNIVQNKSDLEQTGFKI